MARIAPADCWPKGIDLATLLEVQDAQGSPAMKPRALGELGRWAITESDRHGITVRPWRPHPRAEGRT